MIVGQNALLNQYVPTFYIKNISDGQILVYDSTRKAFINTDNLGGSGGATRLGQLLDVNPSVDNPLSLQNGQALVYNSFSNLWENQFTDYNTLLNKPVIPTNSSFSFAGLSDTAKPSLPNGYVKWDSTGTQLIYSTTIPASSITGLATVATTGNYNDLTNKPVIPPATSAPLDQVVYGTGSGVTSSNTLTYDSSVNTLTVGASGPALITSDPGQSLTISGDTSVTLTTSNLDRLSINAGGAFAVGGDTGTSGQVLVSQGSAGVPIWQTIGEGTGTVTSVAATGNNGISVTGSPITSIGTLVFGLGNITPTSVSATGTVTGSNLSGTNTGDQTIVISGDATGSGIGPITLTLNTINLTPGIYGDSDNIPVVTVNNKGLVTSVTTMPVDTTVSDLLPTDGVATETYTIQPRHQYIVTGRLEIVGHVINNGRIAVL